MNTIKSIGLVGLAVTAMFATQAFATQCPTTSPVAAAGPMQGSPVCIAPYGEDGSGTGLVNILAGPGNPNHNGHSIISSGPSVNPYTDQTVSAYWSIGGSGSAVSTILLQIAGYANRYTFGIYQYGNTSNTLTLFSDGTNGTTAYLAYNALTGVYTVTPFGGGTSTTADLGSASFGFFLTTPTGNTFYSNPAANEAGGTLYPNGTPHMVAYDGNGKSKINAAGGAIKGTWLTNEYIMAWEDLPFGSSDLDYNDFIVMVESVHPVPEPATLGMFGLGVLLLGSFTVLRRRSSKLEA